MSRKPRINEQQLLLLYGQPGMTHDKIAEHLGVSRSAVTRAINRIKKNQPELVNNMDLDAFRAEEANTLTSVRMTLMALIMAKLKSISSNDIGVGNMQQFLNTYGMLIEKERLLTGQSTKNEAHLHVHAYKELSDDFKKQIIEYTDELTKQAIQNSRSESLQDEVIADLDDE